MSVRQPERIQKDVELAKEILDYLKEKQISVSFFTLACGAPKGHLYQARLGRARLKSSVVRNYRHIQELKGDLPCLS